MVQETQKLGLLVLSVALQLLGLVMAMVNGFGVEVVSWPWVIGGLSAAGMGRALLAFRREPSQDA